MALKTDVNVEGVNWNVARNNELYTSKEAFVKQHLNDPDTYPKMELTKKEKTLELAWQAIQDNTPKAAAPIPTPPAKPTTL